MKIYEWEKIFANQTSDKGTALQLFTPHPSPPASDLQRKIVENPETKQVPLEERVSAHVNFLRTIFAQLNVLLTFLCPNS
ncbi:hypothetical protein CapIbe_019818 [Capra ibex]